jgi:hypothetical protein
MTYLFVPKLALKRPLFRPHLLSPDIVISA